MTVSILHALAVLPDGSQGVALSPSEFGDYLRTVGNALSDKKVTPNEAKKLEKELVEMMEAATHLQALLISKSKRKG